MMKKTEIRSRRSEVSKRQKEITKLTPFEGAELKRVFTESKNISEAHFQAAFYFVFGFNRAAQVGAGRFEHIPMPRKKNKQDRSDE